jgi:hypothetical protein
MGVSDHIGGVDEAGGYVSKGLKECTILTSVGRVRWSISMITSVG